MKWLFNRISEPSSAAGAALIYQNLPVVISDPKNATAWAGLLGGFLAIFLPEKKVQ